jgi:hypothetical protein
MTGKEMRKNDNDKANDNPEDDGTVSLTPTLALTLPRRRGTCCSGRQNSALVAEL